MFDPQNLPPGPKGHWLLGSFKEKWLDPDAFFRANIARFGDIACFRLGPVRVFQLNSPALIREHFHTKSEFCIRGKGFEKLHPVLGDGLFTAEGEVWEKARKIFNPHFAKAPVSALEPMIRRVASTICAAIETDRVIDVKTICAAAALQVVFEFNLQIPWQPRFIRINQLTETVKNSVQHQIHSLWSRFQWIPTANNRIFWEGSRELRGLTEEIIALGRKESPPDSLLKQLVNLADAGEISHKHLVDQIITLLVTGHETVANTLCWALELLALNHSAQDKFAQAALDREVQANKVFLDCVVQEIIRLYPAAWIISHEAVRAHQLGQWKIPPKALIFVLPYFLHRDTRLWPEADCFKPERFARADGKREIQPYQYVPFGGGARHCIGNSLAKLELQLILEEVAKRFVVTAVNSTPTPPEFSMTIRPKTPIRLKFSLRNTAAKLRSSTG